MSANGPKQTLSGLIATPFKLVISADTTSGSGGHYDIWIWGHNEAAHIHHKSHRRGVCAVRRLVDEVIELAAAECIRNLQEEDYSDV